MNYKTREIVMPKHLNNANKLFGGQVLMWIDKEAAMFAACQMKTTSLVTAHMGEINFKHPGNQGDYIEIGCELIKFGRTSVTIKCTVHNMTTDQDIVVADNIVFVAMDEFGNPTPHGQSSLSAS